MMKNLARILMDEHRYILLVAKAIQRECEQLQTGKEVDVEFFEKAIDFIRNYADKFHHAKEEHIFFQEMDRSLDEIHCDPREHINYEHDVGRKFVAGLEKALKECNKKEVLKNARGYAELIEEHIFEENTVLYPMVETAIKPGRQKWMTLKAERVEEEHFKGTKQKYLAIAKEFEQRLEGKNG